MELKNQQFGIEVEFFGITRYTAMNIVQTTIRNNNHTKNWKIVRDASVVSNGYIQNSESCELVSPILTFNDIPVLMEIISNLKAAGAKVNDTCGIHIHLGLENHDLKSIKNLIKYFDKYEHMFRKSLNVLPGRERYTKKLSDLHNNLINNISTVKNMDQLKKLWYSSYGASDYTQKYNNSRYSSVNLHNIWYKGVDAGTIEFRLFNSTLNTDEIFSYIYLALAISAKAINSKSVNGRKNDKVDDVHLFPKILGGLGITSRNEETKTVYKTLTKNMK